MSGVNRYISTHILPGAGDWNSSVAPHTWVHAADYDHLEQECERLRDQVKILQSDANSWQSGYNRGRKDRVAHGRSELDAALKQVEGLRELLIECRDFTDTLQWPQWVRCKIDAALLQTEGGS